MSWNPSANIFFSWTPVSIKFVFIDSFAEQAAIKIKVKKINRFCIPIKLNCKIVKINQSSRIQKNQLHLHHVLGSQNFGSDFNKESCEIQELYLQL